MLGNTHKMFLENPYSDYMSMSFIVNISYSGKEQKVSLRGSNILFIITLLYTLHSLYMAAYYGFYMTTPTEIFGNTIQN